MNVNGDSQIVDMHKWRHDQALEATRRMLVGGGFMTEEEFRQTLVLDPVPEVVPEKRMGVEGLRFDAVGVLVHVTLASRWVPNAVRKEDLAEPYLRRLRHSETLQLFRVLVDYYVWPHGSESVQGALTLARLLGIEIVDQDRPDVDGEIPGLFHPLVGRMIEQCDVHDVMDCGCYELPFAQPIGRFEINY